MISCLLCGALLGRNFLESESLRAVGDKWVCVNIETCHAILAVAMAERCDYNLTGWQKRVLYHLFKYGDMRASQANQDDPERYTVAKPLAGKPYVATPRFGKDAARIAPRPYQP